MNSELAALRKQDADEMRKEAEGSKKANAAAMKAGKASSASMAATYAREAERESKKASAARDKRATISKKVADKTRDVARVQLNISNAEEADRKKQAADNVQRQRTLDRRIRELESQLAEQAVAAVIPKLVKDPSGKIYDFFISHASEDKADFVDALVDKATDVGLDIWYDKFEITWGDSLRKKIDEGLSSAYFGVVVMSESFFKKPWTQYELDGIVQKDILGTGRLLPIWHKVTLDEVAKHTPSLSGRLALNTAIHGVADIVDELLKMRDKLPSPPGSGPDDGTEAAPDSPAEAAG